MRWMLLVLGVLLALFGAAGPPAAGASHGSDPCCCDEVDEPDAHCCNFDGGRCCVSASVLPASPVGRALAPTPSPEPASGATSESRDCPRAMGPPPTPPPIA